MRRELDSDLWQDDDFQEMPILARLLLIGIITTVDDEGAQNAHPALLRSKIFPYEDFPAQTIQDYIFLLRDKKFITLYQNGNSTYLRIDPRWLGKRYGATPKGDYGFNWKGLSASAKRRDDHRCQGCGRTNCRLGAHHITPLGSGGKNELENLITLCSVCHGKAHKKVK